MGYERVIFLLGCFVDVNGSWDFWIIPMVVFLGGNNMSNKNGMREAYQLVINLFLLPVYLILGLVAFISFLLKKKK